MTLTLYNSLTRQKQAFESLEPRKVQLYCCGMTVYDYCHLGHARTCLVWDVVRRYLQWRGYAVQYIQNFTDIDDKILRRAREEGVSMGEISERFIAAYFEDMDRLGIGRADAYPRATHFLDGIQRLIAELEQKEVAYAAAGDVYYAVRQFPDYGKLSGRKLEDLQAGASGRVEIEPEAVKKRDPFDFALWKAAKPEEPSWESPWGPGRPGWHIECSAMVRDRLGETIDIHVGGSDLIFPHHENEIAQSEAATGKPLARYWLHNGMVKVGGEKMSKSLGNFTTIRDLLARDLDPMAIRLFILQAHYRKPVDFTAEALAAATNGWQTLKDGLLFGHEQGAALGWGEVDPNLTPAEQADNAAIARFNTIVDDDFNFSGGLAVLFDLAKTLQKEGNLLVHTGKATQGALELQSLWRSLVTLANVLGFHAESEAAAAPTGQLSEAAIEDLIAQRAAARKVKNFAESDRLRDELQAQGIVLVDKPGGVTTWHRG
ncbi:MAG: cysteine--tRNA ligase [Spirulinaceae cyanobacterium SM2_1_0]|nr:cysteine--tRNA ligase [Spirulinaceae cyanobacterium SM2_1_0]